MDHPIDTNRAHSPVRSQLVRRHPVAAPTVVGLMLVGGVAAIDWTTGSTVSVVFPYAVAVLAVTWLAGRRAGLVAATVAATAGLGVAIHVPGAIGPAVGWNTAMEFGVLAAIALLAASLRESLIEQRTRATVDALTGAMTRHAFEIVAERERLRSGRNGSAITLACFDLDDFEAVNDRLGHEAGDRLLRVFAASVRSAIRSTDVLSRLGGDEFILLLPETDAKDAVVVVDRVRRILAELCQGERTPITASVGIATYRFPPSSIDAMVAGADELMSRAKSRGGDTVVGSVVVGPWTRWSDHIRQNDETLTWQ